MRECLLALDLGTTMGFAVQSEGAIVSGSNDYKPRRHESANMRFLTFQRWLADMHKKVGITEVVYEEVHRHRGVAAAHIYGGFLAVLAAFCEERCIPYEGVTVQAIKKFATGKGNADKDAVMAAVKEKWGFNPKDDNEADALALLHLRLYDVLN